MDERTEPGITAVEVAELVGEHRAQLIPIEDDHERDADADHRMAPDPEHPAPPGHEGVDLVEQVGLRGHRLAGRLGDAAHELGELGLVRRVDGDAGLDPTAAPGHQRPEHAQPDQGEHGDGEVDLVHQRDLDERGGDEHHGHPEAQQVVAHEQGHGDQGPSRQGPPSRHHHGLDHHTTPHRPTRPTGRGRTPHRARRSNRRQLVSDVVKHHKWNRAPQLHRRLESPKGRVR
jgi:hypothetical protein